MAPKLPTDNTDYADGKYLELEISAWFKIEDLKVAHFVATHSNGVGTPITPLEWVATKAWYPSLNQAVFPYP